MDVSRYTKDTYGKDILCLIICNSLKKAAKISSTLDDITDIKYTCTRAEQNIDIVI